MRSLSPTRLFGLPSGLWAVDAVQPVAGVFDPATGTLIKLVPWADLPPAPVQAEWPLPSILDDGEALWIQADRPGPLVRVTIDGISAAVWTQGMQLAACGDGAAWCTGPRPQQELVSAARFQRLGPSRTNDRLLHVDRKGRSRTVVTDARVRRVVGTREAAWLELNVEPRHLRHLGAETYEVVWSSSWVPMPWGDEPPERIHVGTVGQLVGPDARDVQTDGSWWPTWFDARSRKTVEATGQRWRLGAVHDRSRDADSGTRAVAAAFDESDSEVHRVDLGPGRVVAAAAIGHRLAVAVERRRLTLYHSRRPVELLAIDGIIGATDVVSAPDAIDITSHCWPLVERPRDADAYLRDVVSKFPDLNATWHSGKNETRPLADGLHDARAVVVGDWPEAYLEWTFTFDARPGVRLRRRVPLFDELGRIHEPELADMHLMEDLDTRTLPHASQARDGILDV